MKRKILVVICVLIILSLFSVLCIFKYEKKTNIPNEETSKEKFFKFFNDDDIFSEYYDLAYDKLQLLNLDEKIGQLLIVRYPSENVIEDLKTYKFSGLVFYEKDFKNKTKEEVKQMINDVQSNSNIPLLTAVDEEGGLIVRISSNKNLSPYKFKSPKVLYNLGGMEEIKKDTIEKSTLLEELGINLNFAPVVDVSTEKSDYMFMRSLGQDTKTTALFSKTVIETSKNTKVSYTLKHFPGYGNNVDTHTGSAYDDRSYESILNNDIPPFIEGINAGAEIIMVSHNIVNSIDKENPASLSLNIHKLLTDELNFSGIIITDDLYMGAITNIENASIKAVLAGNHLLITTDYKNSFNSIKKAVLDNTINEETINKLVFKTLAWKFYKGLLSK